MFVNDLSRNCYFDYTKTTNNYPHLDTYIYSIQVALMLNKTANPANALYDLEITGTTNLTSSVAAYSFAAKGHYY